MPGGITGISFSYNPYLTYYILQDDSGSNFARTGSQMTSLTTNANNASTEWSSYCTYNNLIYQCGGFNGSTDQNNLDSYNPLTNKWTALATATGRESAGFEAVGGNLYYFGGTTANNTVSSTRMDIYNIQNNSWTTGAAIPIANGNGTFASCVYNSSIYMIGGFTQTGAISNITTYRYDVASDTWTLLANMLNANGLSYAAAVTVNNFIYLIGGKDGSSGNAVNTTYQYNIQSNSWKTLKTMITATFATNAVLLNNKIYTLGGETTVAISTVAVYDVTNNSWSTDSLNLTNTTGNTAGFSGVVTIEPIGKGGV